MVEGKRRKQVPLVLFNGIEETPCWDKSRKRTRSAGTQKMQEDSAVDPTEWYGGWGQNRRSKSSTSKDSSQLLFLSVISRVWVFRSQLHLFFQTSSLSLVLQSPTLTCHLGVGQPPRESAWSTGTRQWSPSGVPAMTLRLLINGKLKKLLCCRKGTKMRGGEQRLDLLSVDSVSSLKRQWCSSSCDALGVPIRRAPHPPLMKLHWQLQITCSPCGWNWVIPQYRHLILSTGLRQLWTRQHLYWLYIFMC